MQGRVTLRHSKGDVRRGLFPLLSTMVKPLRTWFECLTMTVAIVILYHFSASKQVKSVLTEHDRYLWFPLQNPNL